MKVWLPVILPPRFFPAFCWFDQSTMQLRLQTFFTCAILLTSCVMTRAAGPSADFLKAHCYDCHQGESAEAGLDLVVLSSATELKHSDVFQKWVKVVDRVNAGEMPPRGSEPPPKPQRDRFVTDASVWLETHQQAEFDEVGRVHGRRLTHLQLERSLHDLLGIDIPLASRLPEEPRTHGFANVAKSQSISHHHLQNHLNLVDAALDEAFRRALSREDDEWQKTFSAEQVARTNPERRCREPEMLDGKAVVWSSRLIFYGRLPVTTARADGWYRLKIRASALNSPKHGGVWCTVRTGRCVSSAPLLAWAGAFEAQPESQEWTFEAWLPEGEMFEVRPGDANLKMGRFAGGQVGAGEGTPQDLSGVAIEEIQLERFHKSQTNDQIREWLLGDLNQRWDKKSKQSELHSKQPEADVEVLLRRFAQRAFRRPVTQDVIRPYIDLVHENLDAGASLLDALRGGYRAILCSPRFLHFQATPGDLDAYALASQLSYFLWNSPPDAALLLAASDGSLLQDAVLRHQTERMLQHPRGSTFVKDFADGWLDLHNIDFTEPDRRLYPDFDVIVQQSMLDETHTFLQEMLDQNLSVSHLIDSEFTYLNSRLAKFYNIDSVSGDELQKVALRPSDHRGGLLTQGSILKVTANGTDTSPVIRGVWVSERLLGIEIPPPPTNVPAIEPDIRGATTIREMLAKHKSDAACASCHQNIDPPGFALENFDAAGRWRDTYRTASKNKSDRQKIDASFEFPDGRRFENVQEFRAVVLQDPAALAKNVVRQLITFGTGAVCEFADRDTVAEIVEHCRDQNYGLRSLVAEVVCSDIFRRK